MKHLRSFLPIVGIVILIALIVTLFALTSGDSNRIAVTNSGIDVITVKVEGSETKNLLGPNGTGYFDLNTKIQIGDAAINFGRGEVVNTGSGQIQLIFQEVKGAKHKSLLGEGGSICFGKPTPFKMGNVSIALAK